MQKEMAQKILSLIQDETKIVSELAAELNRSPQQVREFFNRLVKVNEVIVFKHAGEPWSYKALVAETQEPRGASPALKVLHAERKLKAFNPILSALFQRERTILDILPELNMKFDAVYQSVVKLIGEGYIIKIKQDGRRDFKYIANQRSYYIESMPDLKVADDVHVKRTPHARIVEERHPTRKIYKHTHVSIGSSFSII